MQCNFQPLREHVVKYNQGDDGETLGQTDEESEEQIPNNEVGEEVFLMLGGNSFLKELRALI